jgi:ATP phosphoribosyltransferase
VVNQAALKLKREALKPLIDAIAAAVGQPAGSRPA